MKIFKLFKRKRAARSDIDDIPIPEPLGRYIANLEEDNTMMTDSIIQKNHQISILKSKNIIIHKVLIDIEEIITFNKLSHLFPNLNIESIINRTKGE